MKKTVLSALLLLLVNVFASEKLFESFEGTVFPPEGWSQSGDNTWTQSKFNYTPTSIVGEWHAKTIMKGPYYTSRLHLPKVTVEEGDSITFFEQASAGVNYSIEHAKNAEGPWTVITSGCAASPQNSLNSWKYRAFSLHEVGIGSTIFLRIVAKGTSASLNKPVVVDGVFVGSKASSISSTHSFSAQLNNNYPNPFNPSTTISFTMAKNEQVTLTIYNMQGQLVKELMCGIKSAGVHNVQFDGSRMQSGVYVYKLKVGNEEKAKSMLLIK